MRDLIFKWILKNIDEETVYDILFWVCPIGSCGKLDINLREIAGLPVWHRIAWYNLHLLFFKVGGKLRLLNKDLKEYYDALEEYRKTKC